MNVRSFNLVSLIFLHRFYSNKLAPICDYHDISATILYLATKVHPNGRGLKLRYLIPSVISISSKKSILIKEDSREYQRWSNVILYWEVELCYFLHGDFSFAFGKSISMFGCDSFLITCRVASLLKVSRRCLDHAQAVVNDTFRFGLFLKFPELSIISSCLYIASRLYKEPVPVDIDWNDYGGSKLVSDTVKAIITEYGNHQTFKGKFSQNEAVIAMRSFSSPPFSSNPYPVKDSPIIPKNQDQPTPPSDNYSIEHKK